MQLLDWGDRVLAVEAVNAPKKFRHTFSLAAKPSAIQAAISSLVNSLA
jgi:hypothetical protein